jgi:hypothetical protein
MASGAMTTSRNAFLAMNAYMGSTGTSMTSGMMTSSLNAFNAVGVYMKSTASVATAFDYYSSGHVIDNTITKGDLDKINLSMFLGNTTYDGTTFVLFDHAGTTYIKYEVTTAERTRTT